LFYYFVLVDGSSASALARFDERHPLTLDGLFEITHYCIPSNACCACTHYLVFKEPEAQPKTRRLRLMT
jgi:hypothetical protein